MTAVSTILTDVAYDLKLSSTEQTSRQAELISYMNRIIRNGITPTLMRFDSDYGMKEWTTTEASAYVREYSLPSDFVSFSALWCIEEQDSGALAAAASGTSVTLASTASSSDDTYNGYLFRLTSGTYADEQTNVSDYAGSTRVATLSPTLSGTPSTDNYVIFDGPVEGDELIQMGLSELYNEYGSNTSKPAAYALDRNANLVVGGIPNTDDLVFFGLYFYLPTLLTTTTDTLPYNDIFDEIVRAYTSEIGMLRDEYNIQVEEMLMARIQADVASVMRYRVKGKPHPGQSKIMGSAEY
jgi:hypothetical protein